MASTKKANRPAKRNLVRWNDDLDKQVLLIVQYACNEAGVRIPWDDVARMMCEVTDQPVTGGAIIQHLSKLRSRMESYELGVPPPLKRGLPANIPSKIYAPGNKRKVKLSKVKTPKSGVLKPKQPKNGKLKIEDEEDSESSPVCYDSEQEDSEWDYRGAKKQRRVPVGKGKGRKPAALAPAMNVGKDLKGKDFKIETPGVGTGSGRAGSERTESEAQQNIDSQSPLPRTRGVKHNYAKMDADSDQNSDAGDEVETDEDAEEEDYVHNEGHAKDEIEYAGEISPRTKFETSDTNPFGSLDLTKDSTLRYSNADCGLDLQSSYPFGQSVHQQQPFHTHEFHMPAQTGLGFPQSTGSSFSTERTGSMASRTSAIAPPPYTPHVSPGSYVPTINNGMMNHDFTNDQMIYGDQYISPTDYCSTDFLSSFNNPFSTAQNDGRNGDFL